MSSPSSSTESHASREPLPAVRAHTDFAVAHPSSKGVAEEIPHKDHGEHAKEIDLPPIGIVPVIMMAAVFVALLVGLFILGWLPHHRRLATIENEAQKQGSAAPVVDVAMPKREKTAPALELPGSTRAFQETAVYPRAAGYLKKMNVDIGDRVEAGQVLAEIETPEIDAQLASSQATLEQARASATKSKSDLDLAETTLGRYRGFAQTGGVTQQQLDEKQSAFDQAKSAAAGADATVKADEADVQRLAALQGFQKVIAPFAGTITERNYDVGALLSATTGGSGGSPLFQIDQVDTLRVFVDVPQSYADQIHVGEQASFVIRTAPDKPFVGVIARTAASLDDQTRTLRVEADFPNKDGGLLPGMYGQVRYELKQSANPLLIPSSALVFGAEGTRVAVIVDDNRVAFRTISIGRDLGTELEVTQGLNGDERIVANPGERLADGLEGAIAQPTTAANSNTRTTQPVATREGPAR
jgi:RND family efflux transporter MFP subunit